MKLFKNKATRAIGKHWIDNYHYIAREHLQSVVDQGDDMLLSEFLDDSLIEKIDTPEKAAEVQRAIMFESTKQEQDALNEHQ